MRRAGTGSDDTLIKASENTLRKFPLVIATAAKILRKHGCWLVVRVNENRGLSH